MMIDGRTRLLGLLGKPIGHTLSPRIHNHALRRLDENLVYLPLELLEEDLSALLDLFPRIGGVGLNVTTPYKRNVGRIVRSGDREVETTGVVNTVAYEGVEAVGYATDGTGFVSWMRRSGIEPGVGGVALLGFGATANSLAYCLGLDTSITIVTRRVDAVQRIVDSWFEGGWQGLPVRVVTWEDAVPSAPVLAIAGLPVGFARSPLVARWLSGVTPESEVVDLNYGQGRTPVRDQARDLGLSAHDGVGLLVHQAALSLSLWLDSEVPPELLEEALLLEG